MSTVPAAVDPFILGLPKAELHLHIEGTLEPELKFALAQRNGIALEHATAEEVRASYAFDSLASFLAVYYDSMKVLQGAEDFYDLAMAYLRKAASQNVRYVEIFFDPQAHTSRGVPFANVVGGLRRALVDARRDLGVHAELIMCFLRDFSAEHAMSTLMESLPYQDWILGVGPGLRRAGQPAGEVRRRLRPGPAGGLPPDHALRHRPGEHARAHPPGRRGHRRRPDRPRHQRARAARAGRGAQGPRPRPDVLPDLQRLGHRAARRSPRSRRCSTTASRSPSTPTTRPTSAGTSRRTTSASPTSRGRGREALVQLARNSFEIAWLPGRERERYLAELDAYAAEA